MVSSISTTSADGLDGCPPVQDWVGELGIPAVGLVTRILRLNMLVTRVVDEIAAEAGIALADHFVLGVLRWSPDRRSSPTHLCQVLGRSSGGMTLTLDRLERAGWLSRVQDPDDRRRVVVVLSKAGLEITTAVNDKLHAWESSLVPDPGVRSATERTVDRLLELFADAPAQPTT
jgi:DNA-binding MarR family transcriptional regulator